MNRYRAGGPSKATATTVCQKCLKRGHYSYECSASQQDRPYISRPSRTQQLLNPKLQPKLTNDAPKDPKVKTQDIIKASRGSGDKSSRKRSIDDLDSHSRKRSASVSSYSSDDSISTISTNRSRSRSPVNQRPASRGLERRRNDDYSERRRSRSPHRRHENERSRSPERSEARTRSRSPHRGSRRPSDPPKPGSGSREYERDRQAPLRSTAPRERSLSPYSRRMALTRGD